MEMNELKRTREEIFLFQVERNVKNLYKSFLETVEILKDRHDGKMSELELSLPNESYLVRLADSFNEEEMQRARKRILDSGNDCIRNIEEAAKKCGLMDG